MKVADETDDVMSPLALEIVDTHCARAPCGAFSYHECYVNIRLAWYVPLAFSVIGNVSAAEATRKTPQLDPETMRLANTLPELCPSYLSITMLSKQSCESRKNLLLAQWNEFQRCLLRP